MVETDALYELIDTHNIHLEFGPLPLKLQGVFYGNLGGYSLITLNYSIAEDPILVRCVLAEEIGHYFTEPSHSTPKKYARYADRLVHSRAEYRAHKWGANFLIPTDSLLQDIDALHVRSRYDIQILYQVTEYMADVKLDSMAKIKPFWPLPSGKVLSLASWPNIYVINPL